MPSYVHTATFALMPKRKRTAENGARLLKVLPSVLIFRNIHATFLKHFCESTLIYPNPNITFLKSIFAKVMRKS